MYSHITTGVFARLCGTTKHTLIHYDQMGVLSPALMGENGYRYYAPAQLEVFHVIEVLREIDMPLAHIRAYLDRRSPAEFSALLAEQEGVLEEKLARLRQMRSLVRGKRILTDRAMATPEGEIRLVYQAEQHLVCTPALPMTSDWNIAVPLSEHVRFCQSHGIVSPYAVGSMATQQAARTGDVGGYTHYYTRVEKVPRGVNAFCRPAGTYITLCHAQGYDNLRQIYLSILDYAQHQGLSLEGMFFEDVLLDEMSVKGYENYVLEISIRVGNSEPSGN